MSSNTQGNSNTVVTTDANGNKVTTTTTVTQGQSQVRSSQIQTGNAPQIIRTTAEPQVIRTTAPTQTIRTTAPTIYRTAPTVTYDRSQGMPQGSRVVTSNTTTTVNRAPVTTTRTVVNRAPVTTTVQRTPVTTTTTVQRSPMTTSVTYPTETTTHTTVQHQPEVVALNTAPAHRETTNTGNSNMGDLSASTVKFDDESRYRTHAEEMHGYGRNNTKARYGTENRVYNNRFDKEKRDTIVSGKSTSSEYRNDSDCTLI